MVLGPDARGQAVLDAVGPAQRLVLVGEPLDGDDRAEDLVLDLLVVKLPNHLCHTLGRSLTQTVPREPPLSEPSATGQELTPGDRVEGLGNFGKPTGEFGTVERANEEDALVRVGSRRSQ